MGTAAQNLAYGGTHQSQFDFIYLFIGECGSTTTTRECHSLSPCTHLSCLNSHYTFSLFIWLLNSTFRSSSSSSSLPHPWVPGNGHPHPGSTRVPASDPWASIRVTETYGVLVTRALIIMALLCGLILTQVSILRRLIISSRLPNNY